LNSRAVSRYFSPKCPKWVPGHKQWNKNWRVWKLRPFVSDPNCCLILKPFQG
jgi:hypothetical protein